jgi:hypothetical protein
MARRLLLVPVAAALFALSAAVSSAGGSLPLGRYSGATGDGHVFQLTVARRASQSFPRKVTHLYLVYDISCRSGPVRAVFFSKIYYGPTRSRRGTFSGTVNHVTSSGTVRLELQGRFTSATKVSGSFRVGVVGKCPIDPSQPALSFHAKR